MLCSLGVGLCRQVASEAGADVNKVVQGLTVKLGVGGVHVCGLWAGVVVRDGLGC